MIQSHNTTGHSDVLSRVGPQFLYVIDSHLVPRAGVEPARPFEQRNLSPWADVSLPSLQCRVIEVLEIVDGRNHDVTAHHEEVVDRLLRKLCKCEAAVSH